MSRYGTGERLHLRLFLEGLEVPVIGAQVAATDGSAATAQIEIVPTDRAFGILPRTVVHLYYLDYPELLYKGADADFQGMGEEGATKEGGLEKYYKLLFMGEVIATGFAKQGHGGRNLTLQCIDFSNYWDSTFLYQTKYAAAEQNVVGRNLQAFLTASATAFDDIVNQPQLLVSYLASRMPAYPAAAGDIPSSLLGGVLSILELLGGVNNLFLGVNDFATISERRVRLLDQVGSDRGDTAAALLDRTTFDAFIKSQLAQLGDVVSFRDLLNLVFAQIYYGVTPVPAGHYRAGKRTQITVDPYAGDVTAEPSSSTSSSKGGDPTDATALAALSAVPGNPAWPLAPGFRVTSERQIWRKIYNRPHNGTDLGVPVGTAVKASYAGIVTLIDENWYKGGGNRTFLFVQHGQPDGPALKPFQHNGTSFFVYTVYGHLQTVSVKQGDTVTQGQVLGASGTTFEVNAKGENHGGPHLHFEVWYCPVGTNPFTKGSKGTVVNPRDWVSEERVKRKVDSASLAGQGAAAAQQAAVQQEALDMILRQGQYAPTDFVSSLYDPAAFMVTPIETAGPVADPQMAFADARAALAAGGPTAEAAQAAPIVDAVEKEREGPSERLITQIFRPDVWFVAPPACNIVFPEEATAVSYSRQLLREVTRIQLETQDTLLTGEATRTMHQEELLRGYYFAPQIRGEDALTQTGNLREVGIGSANATIYEHEKFSGIVPHLEMLTTLSFYAAAEVEGRSIVGDTFDTYARAVAEFNLLRHRYAARQMEVTARFLPRVVCGFPMVVVSRRGTEGAPEPVHFIGMVTSVTHSLSQEGGSTQISLTYARPHKPDALDNFTRRLKALDPDSTTLTTTVDVRTSTNEAELRIAEWLRARLLEDETVSRFSDPATFDGSGLVGPAKGGRIVRVDLVTELPSVEVTVGTAPMDEVDQIDELADSVLTRLDAAAARQVFYTFTVYEEDLGGVLPLEDAIRPPWFSSDYKNDQIGPKVYEPLLGCRSVIQLTSLDAYRRATKQSRATAPSVEFAVSSIVGEYGRLSEKADGVPGYIWRTTYRDVASLPETQSFHKYASGDFQNLEGLNLEQPLPITREVTTALPKSKPSAKLDPRKDRRAAIRAYLSELTSSPAFRG